LPPLIVRIFEPIIATLKQALGMEAFSAEWAKGQTLGLEDAVANALQLMD
jgi:hypothetical protein